MSDCGSCGSDCGDDDCSCFDPILLIAYYLDGLCECCYSGIKAFGRCISCCFEPFCRFLCCCFICCLDEDDSELDYKCYNCDKCSYQTCQAEKLKTHISKKHEEHDDDDNDISSSSYSSSSY